MLRKPKFFGVQELGNPEAFDRAKCERCETLIEFTIHHLTGVTLQRCQCEDWHPVPRRTGVPTAPAVPSRANLTIKRDRREQILAALGPIGRRIDQQQLADAAKMQHDSLRKELRNLVRDGTVQRTKVPVRTGFGIVTRKYLYWRAA